MAERVSTAAHRVGEPPAWALATTEMANLHQRRRKLEAVLLDPVGLVPFSRKWLEYWDRQFYLYMSGQDLNAIRQASVDEFRTVWKYAETPASLAGRYLDSQKDERPLA